MILLADILMAMAPGGQGGAPGQEQSPFNFFILIGGIVLIFYFFIIRPQNKRMKEQQSFMESLKRGDKVITNGGIWGKVAAVTDQHIDLEIANNVKIRMSKSAIAGYQKGEGPVKPT